MPRKNNAQSTDNQPAAPREDRTLLKLIKPSTPQETPDEKYQQTVEAITQMLAESARQAIGEPVKLTPGDLTIKSAEEIVDNIRKDARKREETSRLLGGSSIHPTIIPPDDLITESIGRNDQAIRAKLGKTQLTAITSPNSAHPLERNKDSIVVHPNKNDRTLRVFLSNEQSETKDSPFANAATVTAACEFSRLHPYGSKEIIAQTEKNHQRLRNDYPDKPLSATAIAFEERKMQLDIANIGTNHCFILNPKTGRVRSINNTAKKVPAYHGEIVIAASQSFIDSFGGTEAFQDEAIAKLLTKKLKDGLTLEQALDEFRHKIQIQRKRENYPGTSFSVIGFQVG